MTRGGGWGGVYRGGCRSKHSESVGGGGSMCEHPLVAEVQLDADAAGEVP